MKPKVLLVDDEEKFVGYLQKRLSLRDLEVTVVHSGDAALEALARAPQDVVVLDVLMPGTDGLATLKEIKTREPLTEVIMLTGHASVESAIDGMKFGAYDYLMKPCETDDLVDKIRKAHERRAAQVERIRQARLKELGRRQ